MAAAGFDPLFVKTKSLHHSSVSFYTLRLSMHDWQGNGSDHGSADRLKAVYYQNEWIKERTSWSLFSFQAAPKAGFCSPYIATVLIEPTEIIKWQRAYLGGHFFDPVDPFDYDPGLYLRWSH